MSMAKRLIELTELSENLMEEFKDFGLSIDVARHILRSLPYRVKYELEFFDDETAIRTEDAQEQLANGLLSDIRIAIAAICHAAHEDDELESILLHDSAIENALGDMNSLFYGLEAFQDESYDEKVFSSDFRLENQPLFQGLPIEKSHALDTRLGDLEFAALNFLTSLEHDVSFSFWRRWFQGFLEGNPLDWELQRTVALIPNEDWAKGPDRVAEVIAEIEARMLAERTPLAEDIILDPETARFNVIPIPVQNPVLLQAIIERVNDNLSDALLGQNGLRADEGVARKLNRANTRYQTDTQRLELDYTSAAGSIRRLFTSGELSETDDNLTLLESVEDGTRALRANHPEIAANREQLAKQNLRQLSHDDVELLEDAQTLLPRISAELMAEDFTVDIPQLINDATMPLRSGAPPLPGADETTRIFYRVSRMKQILDATSDKGAGIFDSKGFKTVRLGLTVSGLLSALVTIGLRIVRVL